MKDNATTTKLIHQDKDFEDQTRAGLKKALAAAQELYDQWNTLNLSPCRDIWLLITQTGRVYNESCSDSVKTVPNSLLIAVQAVKRIPQYGYLKNTTSIEGNTVVMDQAAADSIIYSKNVYATKELAIQIGDACREYVKLSNYLDEQFKVVPWPRGWPVMPWEMTGKSFAQLCSLRLEPELLRQIINNIENS